MKYRATSVRPEYPDDPEKIIALTALKNAIEEGDKKFFREETAQASLLCAAAGIDFSLLQKRANDLFNEVE